MKHILPFLTLALAAAPAYSQSTPPLPLDGHWKKQQLTDVFWAEGVAVADVNHDGKPDIIYGPYWFEGPDFTKKHLIYPDNIRSKAKQADGTVKEIEGYKGAKSEENGYSNNFVSAAFDVNGDGWVDYIVVGFPGDKTLWYENPQGRDEPWKVHVALDSTDNESPLFADIDGDGQPDLVCMSGHQLGYATFNPKKPEDKWQWHPVSPVQLGWQKFTHGIGYGDVNGDGKIDLMEVSGWWEQPKSLEGNPLWKHHEIRLGEKGGAQMYAYDVNGDGKPDIITSLSAHEYGLAWYEQTDNEWKRHLITGTPKEPGETGLVFSQLHSVVLADINGDGLTDIVTGKRFWAHGNHGDPEPNAPAVLYWFELKRENGVAKYVPHIIDNDSGVGTQFVVTDVNGDGKPDVVIGNKKGCFVFLQQ